MPFSKSNAKLLALAAAIALGQFLPAVAEAKPPLREVKAIDDPLYYIAVASEIDKYCDSIAGRRAKAISKMYQLRAQANKLGYSDTEIRAYVESKAEQSRMRRKGEAYLAAHGVSYAKPDSFCALGKREIARSSAIGIYLKAK